MELDPITVQRTPVLFIVFKNIHHTIFKFNTTCFIFMASHEYILFKVVFFKTQLDVNIDLFFNKNF